MQRFYYPKLKTTNYTLVINDFNLIHQFIKVLRIKISERIIFFDWIDKYDYLYEIKEIYNKEIILEQVWRNINNSEIDFELNLYQSLPNKLEKIEYIIQKWVEIWIKNFIFYRSDRSQKLFINEKKQERLFKIMIEAVEQSNRNIIPELLIIDKFDLTLLKNDENIFFHTKDDNSILLKNLDFDYNKTINMFVWPEWWFSDTEVNNFRKIFWKKIFLWNRILRTETTWIVVWFYIIHNK